MNSFNKNAVRPIMSTPRVFLASCLAWLRRVLKGDRFDNLFVALKDEILKIEPLKKDKIHMLDYGCGMMEFSNQLKNERVIHEFMGVDIFPTPKNIELTSDARWECYKQISKGEVDLSMGTFNLAITIDVLHHASESDQLKILRGLSMVSGVILVKDHFECGYLSRQLLRLADWYGNYAFGVQIPKSYFTPNTWSTLVDAAGLTQISLTSNVKVHGGLFGLLIPPRFHFISVLTPKVSS